MRNRTMRSSDFAAIDPFRRPSWRWDRVQSLLARDTRCSQHDDEYVKRTRRFVKLLQRAMSEQDEEEILRLRHDEPHLYLAYQVWEKSEHDPEVACWIEARLLARQTYDEIAEETGLSAGAVEWYEKLFFHVTDRLEVTDWVIKQVLIPSWIRSHGVASADVDLPDMSAGNDGGPLGVPFLDGTLKLFAFYGGPHVFEFMRIHVPKRHIRSQKDLDDWADEAFVSQVKGKSNLAVQRVRINRYNAMELFRLHHDLMTLKVAREDGASGAGGNSRDIANIEAFLAAFPFSVGFDGEPHMPRQIVDADKKAYELRTNELLAASAGEDIDLDAPETLPPPRPEHLQPKGAVG